MARKSRSGTPRGMLTPEEVARTAEGAGEGFTVRTTGTAAGRPARSSFSTGFAPESGRGAEVAIDPSQSAAGQISEFNKSNLGVLGTKGANMAIGGWQDPETGVVQQDTSVITPKTTGGLGAAMQMGSYGNQHSIGNLGPTASNPYLGDIVVPEHLHKGQFSQWHDSPDNAPLVTRTSPNRVSIIPSRLEMAGVEADILSEKMGLPNDDIFDGYKRIL